MVKTRNLTLRYSLQQMAYWAVYAGPVSFAAAYLLDKGFHASQVGIILACANFCSCLLQPVLANFADRARRPVLTQLLTLLALLSFCSFGAMQLLAPPPLLFTGLYLVGVLSFDVMVPLMNSVNVYYNARGCRINYGVGRGAGSLAFSVAALVIGYVMELAGADWMPRMELMLLALFVIITLGYPRAGDIVLPAESENAPRREACSLGTFFRRYKWYNLSLLGVLFLAMFHAMTENYLIAIVRPLGGDSGSVGVALFIATMAAVPVLFCFDRVHARFSSRLLLKTAGAMFTLKAVLFLLAPGVIHLHRGQKRIGNYLKQFDQIDAPHARERVGAEDMVKGQSVITAAYALGCASGNLIGGQLIGFFSVTTMLLAGVAMAGVGTLILFLTLGRRDYPAEDKT